MFISSPRFWTQLREYREALEANPVTRMSACGLQNLPTRILSVRSPVRHAARNATVMAKKYVQIHPCIYEDLDF